MEKGAERKVLGDFGEVGEGVEHCKSNVVNSGQKKLHNVDTLRRYTAD